jgi:hypothetical protein
MEFGLCFFSGQDFWNQVHHQQQHSQLLKHFILLDHFRGYFLIFCANRRLPFHLTFDQPAPLGSITLHTMEAVLVNFQAGNASRWGSVFNCRQKASPHKCQMHGTSHGFQ